MTGVQTCALPIYDPFFLYLPYHAPHYPLQARPEDIAKYRGKYMKGWDKLREERYARMKKLGIISENTKLSEPTSNINKFRGPFIHEFKDYYPWESISEAKKDSLDLEMAVFAAMIDNLDQNIGRVIQKLEESEYFQNVELIDARQGREEFTNFQLRTQTVTPPAAAPAAGGAP